MLVSCNPKCKKNNGQTDASLDTELNEVICNVCGDNLPNISEFTKLSMKSTGDIIRNNKRKAFVFPCNSCDKNVEATVEAGVVVGRHCPNNKKGCQINISEAMIHVIKEFGE